MHTLLAAAAITLSTDRHRLSEYLERPFVCRRLSSPATVSSRPSTGDRRRLACRSGDVASVEISHHQDIFLHHILLIIGDN